jgi:hypothetical protein
MASTSVRLIPSLIRSAFSRVTRDGRDQSASATSVTADSTIAAFQFRIVDLPWKV